MSELGIMSGSRSAPKYHVGLVGGCSALRKSELFKYSSQNIFTLLKCRSLDTPDAARPAVWFYGMLEIFVFHLRVHIKYVCTYIRLSIDIAIPEGGPRSLRWRLGVRAHVRSRTGRYGPFAAKLGRLAGKGRVALRSGGIQVWQYQIVVLCYTAL